MANYASIVPLIGGETIAMQNVFGTRPEYILSYEGFENNDKHLVEHYQRQVPYHIIRDDRIPAVPRVDVVNTVCPCAGLSSLSVTSNSDAAARAAAASAAAIVFTTASRVVVAFMVAAPAVAPAAAAPMSE